MLIDFFVINYTGIYLTSVLLFLFSKRSSFYYVLILDIIFNYIPFITLILILLKYFNMFIFRYFNYNFFNKYLVLIIDYILFTIILYSIFNKFNFYIIKFLINNLGYNLIYFYIGLNLIEWKNRYEE